MSKSGGSKNQSQIKFPNPLEALKEVGSSTAKSFKNDFLGKMPEDFMDQMFGPKRKSKVSGNIEAGESLSINEVLTGEREEKVKLQNQIAFERRLREEEQIHVEKKTNELRIELKVLMDEIIVLSKSTQELASETQVAAMQAPVEPGVYHLVFFQKLLEFIKSFREKIEEAGVWLHAVNKRAQRKNYWHSYKKHGGKFLLSGEHYLQRSAG